MRLAEISPIPFGTIARTCEPCWCARECLISLTYANSDVSRTSNLSLSAYLRTAQSLPGQDNMGNDLLMGRLDLTPVLDAHVCRFPITSARTS